MEKIKTAVICVHNSCRSQRAEEIAKAIAGDCMDVYSAGTETKPEINEAAVVVIQDLYGIDMCLTQYSKLLGELPPVDIVITMGCNVSCPFLPSRHRDDWGLEDPTGKGSEAFLVTASQIKEKVIYLKRRIEEKKLHI